MSLYKDASLVMIPSAYKDGKLYSIRPTDGSGDFTFSRGSNLAATRVDVNGLIEKGRENLLLQSNQFDVSANWGIDGGTITGSQAGYDGSTDAWLFSHSSSISYLYQKKSFSASINTASIYVKGGTSSTIRLDFVTASFVKGASCSFDLSNGTAGSVTHYGSSSGFLAAISSAGNDWYRISLTGLTTAENWYHELALTSGNIYIQDAQLEAGLVATDYIETGASTAQAGILEDMPRLDYSGSCPALLLEPQRTNSITQSEYFGSSFWTKSGDVTLTSNYGISPEGYQNADRIVANATAGGHIVYRNISTTGTHTISVFAKASGYNHIFFGYDGGNLNFGIVFNLSNGTISQNPAGLTGDIEAIGSDGWYRCNLTFNYSTTNYYFVVSPHDNSSAYSWTGNGTDGILIYGAQIEYNSSYPTSYIPTYGSSVTRSLDYGNGAGDISTFNDSEGVLYLESSWLSNELGTSTIAISDGSNSNRIILGYIGADDDLYCTSFGGGSSPSLMRYDVGDITTNHKIAIKYKANDFAFWVDGVKRGTQSTGSTPVGLSELSFSSGAGGSKIYGDMKQILYFPTALSDSELAALTTL